MESDSDEVGLFKGVLFLKNMDFPVANRNRLNYSTGCRHVNSSDTESSPQCLLFGHGGQLMSAVCKAWESLKSSLSLSEAILGWC